jgi:acetyl-CoA C-acetyltransferase
MDAFIVDGLRSPFGRHGGALALVRPDDLIAGVIKKLAERSAFAPDEFEDVLIGNTNQAGEDSRNIARNAALLAGLPVRIGGQTVNRLCGSGLAAIVDAARAASAGGGDVFIAGGVESMTRAPFVLSKGKSAFDRDVKMEDSTIGPRFPNAKLLNLVGADTMPETADNVATEFGITRIEADRFAMGSQRKYAEAKQRGFFIDEISAVTVEGRKGAVTEVTDDEAPRPSTTAEQLAALRTINAAGVTTAGNASGINDGAAAVVIANGSAVARAQVRPLTKISAAAIAGVEPRLMGLGPVPAAKKALDRAGLTMVDMDVIELNEAFAAQSLGCLRGWGIPDNDSRVNVSGGAIAVGHPLGASGARIALTASRLLQEMNGRFALVTMCIGIGQGIAIILENVNRSAR